MIDKFCRKMKFNYPQEMFIRMTIAGFIIMIAILFLTSCTYTEKKDLTDMSCNELTNEVTARPKNTIMQNELYTRNVLEIMNLKGCTLE